jgi:membrane fusion protein, heavy metal efflux system
VEPDKKSGIMQGFQERPGARGLARRTQWLIVAGIALIVAVTFGTRWLLNRFSAARSNAAAVETQSSQAPGTFRPTDAQWESLKIAPVQLRSFQTERTTEGKIANDDDATTPVFSPWTKPLRGSR